MNEPVAVPRDSQPDPIIEKRERSATDENQILDEGLDLSGYRGTHDSPFVADYFGIRDLYKTNPEIREQVDFVTGDIIKRSEGESLVFVAKDILDTMSNEMNLQDQDTGIHRLKKVIQLMKAKQKMEMLSLLRDKVAQDIDEMV